MLLFVTLFIQFCPQMISIHEMAQEHGHWGPRHVVITLIIIVGTVTTCKENVLQV